MTVAIATLDRPSGLSACLKAILEGDALPDEVLVIDQGDPGPVARLVASMHTTVPVRHAVSAERGLSRSRNLALRLTSSPVLAMTDDDCIPGPGWVSAIASRLGGDGALGGVTGPVFPADPVGEATMAVSSRLSLASSVFFRPRAPWHVGSGGNFAARVDALRAIGGFDLRLGAGSAGKASEDLDVFMRLLAAGWSIAYDPSVQVSHARQPPGRRWSTRWTYGYGVGATAGIRIRSAPGTSSRLLADWASLRAHRAVGSLRRRNLRGVAEELAVLCATIAGFAHGITRRP